MKQCLSFLILLVFCIPQSMAQDASFKKNNISWNLIDMGLQRFSFQYERMTNDNKMSFTLPMSYRFGEPGKLISSDDSDNSTTEISPFSSFSEFKDESDWYVGLGFMFHPIANAKKVQLFFGPEIRFGEATHVVYSNTYDEENDYTSSYQEPGYDNKTKISYTYSAFLANVGLKYYPIDQLFLGVKLGVGAYGSHSNGLNGIISPALRMGFSF